MDAVTVPTVLSSARVERQPPLAPRPTSRGIGRESALPARFPRRYVIELPTLSVEASLGEAIKLQLRPDPDARPGGMGAACSKVTASLLGGNPDEAPKSFWEGFAAWAERTFPVCAGVG